MKTVTDFNAALAEVKRLAEADLQPTLSDEEVTDILSANRVCEQWAPGAHVWLGETLVPATYTGLRYDVVRNANGTPTSPVTGEKEPIFPYGSVRWPRNTNIVVEEFVGDGLISYKVSGEAPRALWSIPQAVYECWRRKLAKLVDQFDTTREGTSLRSSQIYDHVQSMLERYTPVEVE